MIDFDPSTLCCGDAERAEGGGGKVGYKIKPATREAIKVGPFRQLSLLVIVLGCFFFQILFFWFKILRIFF